MVVDVLGFLLRNHLISSLDATVHDSDEFGVCYWTRIRTKPS